MPEMKPLYPSRHAAPRYVDVLGEETTIEFLLNFGGAEIYVSNDPKGRGMVEGGIGNEKTKCLVDATSEVTRRIPLATKWLAKCLYAQGLSIAAIARRLRITDTTARRYVNGTNVLRTPRAFGGDK